MIVTGWVQWNPFYTWKEFCVSCINEWMLMNEVKEWTNKQTMHEWMNESFKPKTVTVCLGYASVTKSNKDISSDTNICNATHAWPVETIQVTTNIFTWKTCSTKWVTKYMGVQCNQI